MRILVEDIMTRTPWCCGPETNLAAVTELMWTHDCGALPVVGEGRVLGMITDRDVAIALGTRDVAAREITAIEAATVLARLGGVTLLIGCKRWRAGEIEKRRFQPLRNARANLGKQRGDDRI